jgi:hypothetical protein
MVMDWARNVLQIIGIADWDEERGFLSKQGFHKSRILNSECPDSRMFLIVASLYCLCGPMTSSTWFDASYKCCAVTHCRTIKNQIFIIWTEINIYDLHEHILQSHLWHTLSALSRLQVGIPSVARVKFNKNCIVQRPVATGWRSE